jgi:hypothetical protein
MLSAAVRLLTAVVKSLSGCCQVAVKSLSAAVQLLSVIVKSLSGCCQSAVRMLSNSCQLLSGCCRVAVRLLSGCCQVAVRLLSSCCPLVSHYCQVAVPLLPLLYSDDVFPYVSFKPGYNKLLDNGLMQVLLGSVDQPADKPGYPHKATKGGIELHTFKSLTQRAMTSCKVLLGSGCRCSKVLCLAVITCTPCACHHMQTCM